MKLIYVSVALLAATAANAQQRPLVVDADVPYKGKYPAQVLEVPAPVLPQPDCYAVLGRNGNVLHYTSRVGAGSACHITPNDGPDETYDRPQEPDDPYCEDKPKDKPKKDKKEKSPKKGKKDKRPNKGGGNGPEGADPGNNPDKGNDDEN